jgi:arylsulfatase A-like enzyme
MRCENDRWRITDERLRKLIGLYDAGILYVDRQIGLVRDALAELGILDQTLFIVTSDHGEDLGEHGRIGHGVFLHDPILAVPLVIRYPALFPAGARIAAPVSLIDVLPTIEQVLGDEPTPRKDGMSLVPSEVLAGRPAVVHAEADPFEASVTKDMERLYGCDMRFTLERRLSLAKERLKYVWASSGRQELFDMAVDPGEEHDLAEERAETSRDFRKELLDWFSTVRPARSTAERGVMDARTRQQLESLGYVQ